MAAWLLDNGRDEYLTVYGKIRGGVLQRSLNSLRNHQRSVSGGSTHGGGIGSPMLVRNIADCIILVCLEKQQNSKVALLMKL